LNVKKILNVKNSISLVKYFDGKVGVVDEKNIIRIYSVEDYKLVGGFKLNFPENDPLENTVDISPYGNYLSIAVKGKNKTTVWDIKQKKLLHTLGWHRGEVLTVSFDFDENYLLTGGMDGRAYLWSVELGKMVTSLPPHPDYILASGFSRNSLWTATGSFDKLISITNISSMNIIYRKKSHRGAVTKIKFLKNHTMISGDKTGEILIWNYMKGGVIARLQSVADRVIDFTTDENEEYLFVITKEKKVYLYDLKEYELLTDSFIKLGELPSSITFVNENSTLWIGTFGGSVYIFDIYEDVKILHNSLLKKDFATAYELVKTNPFLKRTEDYKKLEEIWEKTLSSAYNLMEKGEYDKAKQILSPFLAVPHKRSIIQTILNDFAEFEKFKNAVMKKKYPLAYSLAAKYPSFKDTIYYKKMEDDFRKIFNKAKELIRVKGSENRVRELLMPFRGVAQKTPLIQALFNDKQLYDLIKSYLMAKKFEEFFSLVDRYPFLYETPEYQSAIKFGEKLLNVANKALKEGDYKHAILYAETLKSFPKYKEIADNIINKAKIMSTFLSAIANKNYELIEKLVHEYPFLGESEDYLRFKRSIKNKFKKAERAVSEGNIKGIIDSLKDLAKVKLYSTKIENLIKAAYLNQLLNVLKEKEKSKLEKGINNYISLFGYDNEIEDIVKMANKLKLNPTIKSMEKTRLFDIESLPDFIWEKI
jgi:WD40 repeat protein